MMLQNQKGRLNDLWFSVLLVAFAGIGIYFTYDYQQGKQATTVQVKNDSKKEQSNN